MIDGDHGDIAVDQLHHLGVVEVHTGDHHAVHTAVMAVLQVGHRFAAQVAVDKGDIVAQPLHPDFETCLLYTSDAADEEDSVDLGGRNNHKKKKIEEVDKKKNKK